MNENDLQLLVDFRRDIPEPEPETAQRIYRLATGTSAHERTLVGRKRLWSRRPRLVLAALVTTLAVAAGAGAAIYQYVDDSSPGLSSGFSAFNRLPPVTSLPTQSGFELTGHTPADMMGVSITQFEQGLRLLQTNLTLGPSDTQGQGQLYAYIGDDNDNTYCMILTGQGAECVTPQNAPHINPYYPGVMPAVFPGNPGETPAVTALVADDVSSISLVTNGQSADIPIVNNSIYANLTGIKAGDTISLDATYSDGGTHEFPLQNCLTPSQC